LGPPIDPKVKLALILYSYLLVHAQTELALYILSRSEDPYADLAETYSHGNPAFKYFAMYKTETEIDGENDNFCSCEK
jgi:hypothetical protein